MLTGNARHVPRSLPVQIMSPTLSALIERLDRRMPTLASIRIGFLYRL